MSSAIHSTRNDVTAKQSAIGGGMDQRLLFLCSHKGLSAGAKFKRRVPWKCATCARKEQP
jgi:hypothetical protein